MAIFKANDKYRSTLRSTWVSDPAAGSLLVTSIPDNTPTLVVVGWGTDYETVFSVTASSGSSAADYALTGVVRLRGYDGNLAENTAVNCLNNEEFFNQYLVTSDWYDMSYEATTSLDGDNGTKQRITLTGNVEFTFDNIPDSRVFMLRITQDGTGSRTVTWPVAGLTWLSPTNDVDTTASTTTVYGFIQTATDEYDAYLMGKEY